MEFRGERDGGPGPGVDVHQVGDYFGGFWGCFNVTIIPGAQRLPVLAAAGKPCVGKHGSDPPATIPRCHCSSLTWPPASTVVLRLEVLYLFHFFRTVLSLSLSSCVSLVRSFLDLPPHVSIVFFFSFLSVFRGEDLIRCWHNPLILAWRLQLAAARVDGRADRDHLRGGGCLRWYS